MSKWHRNYVSQLSPRLKPTEEYQNLVSLWIPDHYIAWLLDSYGFSEIANGRYIEIRKHKIFVPYQIHYQKNPPDYSQLINESIRIYKKSFNLNNL